MENHEIKSQLLLLFVNKFDLDNDVDFNGEMNQSVTTDVEFDFNNDKEESVNAFLSVTVNVFLYRGADNYHDPIGDGRSENQGDGAQIETWHWSELEVYIDGQSVTDLISLEDIDKAYLSNQVKVNS